MITTTIKRHQRKIEMTSGCFLHSGHAARTGQSNKRGFWMKQWLRIQNVVALHTAFKNTEKQYTFRSPSGKEKQLYYVVIDRRNRRYCTDAESNDMGSLGSGHRSVNAHFRFPCAKKKKQGGLENTNQKRHPYTNTRYPRRSTSVEPCEDPDSSEKHQETD